MFEEESRERDVINAVHDCQAALNNTQLMSVGGMLAGGKHRVTGLSGRFNSATENGQNKQITRQSKRKLRIWRYQTKIEMSFIRR